MEGNEVYREDSMSNLSLKQWRELCPPRSMVSVQPPGREDFYRSWTTGEVFMFAGKLMVRVNGLRHPVQVRYVSVEPEEVSL